jgi:hypothetical protein
MAKTAHHINVARRLENNANEGSRRIDPAIAAAGRRSGMPDGGMYAYPTRASDSSLGLSIAVVVIVVGLLLFAAFALL